jgi:hypothetical protein
MFNVSCPCKGLGKFRAGRMAVFEEKRPRYGRCSRDVTLATIGFTGLSDEFRGSR